MSETSEGLSAIKEMGKIAKDVAQKVSEKAQEGQGQSLGTDKTAKQAQSQGRGL